MAMAKTGALFPPWKAAVARTIRDIEVPRMKARLWWAKWSAAWDGWGQARSEARS